MMFVGQKFIFPMVKSIKEKSLYRNYPMDRIILLYASIVRETYLAAKIFIDKVDNEFMN